MHKLIVSLPTNREFEGRLTLEEENGRVLAGPFPVCGLADRAAAGRHGNPSGRALLPFGDTPLGRYRVTGIHATGPKTSLPAASATDKWRDTDSCGFKDIVAPSPFQIYS